MESKYLVVDKDLVPAYCEKVLEARRLLDFGEAKDVSEAAKMVGISRSTFYKYKDKVKEMSAVSMNRHAIISMMMSHQVGVLSTVLHIISEFGYSVWTITQNPPVESKATVVITLDLGQDSNSIEDMLEKIRQVSGLSRVLLLGIE